MVHPVMRSGLAACCALAWQVAGAAALADPTRPPLPAAAAPAAVAADAAPSYTVQSIVFGAARRLAVINGRQVHEGSSLGEARVVQIQRDAVVLEIQGRRRAMPMYASAAPAPHLSITRRSADAGAQNHD
jgi:MSHA biogenesis protein MshK